MKKTEMSGTEIFLEVCFGKFLVVGEKLTRDQSTWILIEEHNFDKLL